MLKIKDNVDLKELEKFKLNYNDNYGYYYYYERNIGDTTAIKVNVWNKKIVFQQENKNDTKCLEILYDLIKADLVEKVD